MSYQASLDLGIPAASEWERRDFHGFAQYRECPADRWRFYVCGFDATVSGQAGYCNVLRTDGTEQSVPIDADDRIFINGRSYGRRHWNH